MRHSGDDDKNEVVLADGKTVPYDFLVLATGSASAAASTSRRVRR